MGKFFVVKKKLKPTFSPFALLIALKGLNTRKTLKIFIKDTVFFDLAKKRRHFRTCFFFYRLVGMSAVIPPTLSILIL